MSSHEDRSLSAFTRTTTENKWARNVIQDNFTLLLSAVTQSSFLNDVNYNKLCVDSYSDTEVVIGAYNVTELQAQVKITYNSIYSWCVEKVNRTLITDQGDDFITDQGDDLIV